MGDSATEISNPSLAEEHKSYYERKGIEKVTENVYFAFGYGIANVIILEGPESLVIIDTTETKEVAEPIVQDLRQITEKPIRDIIYTHSHPDHTGGVQAFIEDPANPPDVWAHETLVDLFWYANTYPRSIAGGAYQFGYLLRSEKIAETIVNQGLGPPVEFTAWDPAEVNKDFGGKVPPNKILKGKRNEVVIGGIPLTLLHLPGETKDHLVVWWEEKRVLVPGDNIYRCFPSLYSIRGVLSRSVHDWTDSLEQMAELKPRYLVPSHSGAVEGEAQIAEIIRSYTDGMYFVNDQTLRYINQGMHPIEIARKVKLPPSMAAHPYLQPHYGKLEWTVRNLCVNYFGWFSGLDLLELSPYLPEERSQKLVDLVGKEKLVSAAEEAIRAGDTCWAIELTTHVLNAGRDNEKAWDIKIAALESLSQQQVSSHARLTLKTFALKEWNFSKVCLNARRDMLYRPSPAIFRVLKWNVEPEKADVNSDVLQLDLTDETDGVYYLYFSHAVLMYVRGEAGEKSSIKFTGDIQAFREYVWGVRKQDKVLDDSEVKLYGDVENFCKFLDCFERKW